MREALQDGIHAVTLQRLLASRDARHAMQMRLIGQHPGLVLVCLTVVVPGSVKRNRQSLIVARAAVEALRRAFRPADGMLTERDLDTGYEAYLPVCGDTLAVKRTACSIEDTHPLGRLFDIDVIDGSGVPVTRSAVGGSPRRCLVCGNEARYCMRNRSHTQDEIWQGINAMVDAYTRGNPPSPAP